jgi:hypothetical protein
LRQPKAKVCFAPTLLAVRRMATAPILNGD